MLEVGKYVDPPYRPPRGAHRQIRPWAESEARALTADFPVSLMPRTEVFQATYFGEESDMVRFGFFDGN